MFLKNLITFYDKVEVCSFDGGPAVDIVYIDFPKVIDVVSQGLLLYYGLDKCSIQ